MAGKFVVTRRDNGQYGFALQAANGEIVLVGEGYVEEHSCLVGIEAVRKNVLDRERFDAVVSSDGKPYFVLRAANGEIIGSSQLYLSDSARDAGIAAVIANAPDAELANT